MSSFLIGLESCFDDTDDWGYDQDEEATVRYEEDMDVDMEGGGDEDGDEDGLGDNDATRGGRIHNRNHTSSAGSDVAARCIFDYLGGLTQPALLAEFDSPSSSKGGRKGLGNSDPHPNPTPGSSAGRGGLKGDSSNAPTSNITSHIFSNRLEIDANFDLGPLVRALRADASALSPRMRLNATSTDKMLLEFCEACSSYAFPNPFSSDLVAAARAAKFSNLSATHLLVHDGAGLSLSDSTVKPSVLLESAGVETFDALIRRRKLEWQDALQSVLELLLDGAIESFVVAPDLVGMRRNAEVQCPLISFQRKRRSGDLGSNTRAYDDDDNDIDIDDSDDDDEVFCTFVGVSAPLVARLRFLGVSIFELCTDDVLTNDRLPTSMMAIPGVTSLGQQRWLSRNSEVKCYFVRGTKAVCLVQEVLLENLFQTQGKFFYGDLPFIISSTEFAHSVKIRPVVDSIINKTNPTSSQGNAEALDLSSMPILPSLNSNPNPNLYPSRTLSSLHVSGIFSTKAIVQLTSILQVLSQICVSPSSSSNNGSSNSSSNSRNSNSNSIERPHNRSNQVQTQSKMQTSQRSAKEELFLFRPGLSVSSSNLVTNFEPKAANDSSTISQNQNQRKRQRANQQLGLGLGLAPLMATENPFVISSDASYKSYTMRKGEQRSDYTGLLRLGLNSDIPMKPPTNTSDPLSSSSLVIDIGSLAHLRTKLKRLDHLDGLSKLGVLVQYYTHDDWLKNFTKSEDSSFVIKIKVAAKDAMTKSRWKRLNYSTAVPYVCSTSPVVALSSDGASAGKKRGVDGMAIAMELGLGSAGEAKATKQTKAAKETKETHGAVTDIWPVVLDVLVLEDIRWTGVSVEKGGGGVGYDSSSYGGDNGGSDGRYATYPFFPGMARRIKMPSVSLTQFKEKE